MALEKLKSVFAEGAGRNSVDFITEGQYGNKIPDGFTLKMRDTKMPSTTSDIMSMTSKLVEFVSSEKKLIMIIFSEKFKY